MKKKRVVIIIGPTAVGKTALSINLAQQFNGAVISGDSMQIYRHLDIGTAKVTPQEMADIPHYLINIRDVQQKFTVYEFQKAAYQLINQINQQQKLPLVVGGTGFYIKSLVANLNLGGKNSHLQPFRQQYTQLLTTKGPQYLWDLLQQQDP
ncbi:tRNA (adenosine(37)-N6)-dimethylallyltransferase MiaA, partial [Lactobacillus sp. XV13L]|nr:tRNA (adenosine(37)-N6)-dimethylallyltransferase MiaA [Lactobacillus sp. XV13L]